MFQGPVRQYMHFHLEIILKIYIFLVTKGVFFFFFFYHVKKSFFYIIADNKMYLLPIILNAE